MSKFSFLLCFFIVAFGFISNGSGHEIGIYALKKGDFCLKVTNFGARIISVVLPDKNGIFHLPIRNSHFFPFHLYYINCSSRVHPLSFPQENWEILFLVMILLRLIW